MHVNGYLKRCHNEKTYKYSVYIGWGPCTFIAIACFPKQVCMKTLFIENVIPIHPLT